MDKERAAYQDRIAADPTVMLGKPVVRGTRIPVELVLEELAHNPDVAELLAAHPGLAYAEAIVKGEAIMPATSTG